MKETFYFSHDCNARNDSKIQKLQMRKGLEGIGCYWCIVEMLYEEGGRIPVEEYERISFELRCSYECIKSVIEDFNLFVVKDGCFYSDSVLKRLNERKNKSDKAKKSISARWNKKPANQSDTNDRNTAGNTNVSKKDTNEILIKKSKEKNINKPSIISLSGESVCEPVLKIDEVKEKLLNDDTWKMEACRQSGLSVKFAEILPAQIDNFLSWIRVNGEEGTILFVKDAKRRFNYWWQYHGKKQYENGTNDNEGNTQSGVHRPDVTVRKTEI